MSNDQEFFLGLAAKGKDTWNQWRRADIDRRVTFAGIDFSEAPRDGIDFSGFEFRDYADFSQCKWRGCARRIVGKGRRIVNADSNVFAPGLACFTGATFGFWATFTNTTFGAGVTFGRAGFGDCADFNGATFGWLANFNDAAFGDLARFSGAAFGSMTDFENTAFKGSVLFIGESEEDWAWTFEGSAKGIRPDARKALEERHKESWTLSGSGPDSFRTISFANARFDGEADFSGRTFEEAADFTNARFYYPPNFDAVTNASRIDFTGAQIGFGRPLRFNWTSDTKVPLRLRAFRKIVEDTKNHDLERDLYIEERKAERGVYLRQRWEELKKAPWIERPLIAGRLIAHLLWIAVMGVYWALADYGRSFVRPAAWLVSSGFFFYWCYDKILAPLMPKAGTLADKYEQAVRMLALGNAVPFVGPLTVDAEIKKFLFCAGDPNCLPIPPEGFQVLVVGQNLVSITCVFFIGLALRNYFRIK